MGRIRKATATTSTLARVNQTAIIEALRSNGILTRQQIGENTGLSPATVNRLTTSLLNDGVIQIVGHGESTGGRPSVLLRYSGGTRLVAAFQLRGSRCLGVLVDFDGKIVYRAERVLPPRTIPDPVDPRSNAYVPPEVQAEQTAVVTDLFDHVLDTASRMGSPCLAAGVAVPGVVEVPQGNVGHTPELGWRDMPLGAILRERTDIPIVIENDANALAFGELKRGAGRDLDSLVAVFLDRGFGAGIVTNGELHRGARGEAGEVGYLLVDRTALHNSYADQGDLESRIGAVALTLRARELGLPTPSDAPISAENIFAMAAEGSAAARELADEILDMLSIAIASLVIVLDPELVVVGSSLFGHAESAIPDIESRLTGRIIRVPRMVAATFREDGALLGAAELAAAEVDDYTYVAY